MTQRYAKGRVRMSTQSKRFNGINRYTYKNKTHQPLTRHSGNPALRKSSAFYPYNNGGKLLSFSNHIISHNILQALSLQILQG